MLEILHIFISINWPVCIKTMEIMTGNILKLGCRANARNIMMRLHSFNPLSASCSWDARIGGCRENRLLVPRSPFSRHPLIDRHSLPQWTSHWCISPKTIKLQWTLYVPKTWKLTIMWCHMATTALRGLMCHILILINVHCAKTWATPCTAIMPWRRACK